MHENLKSTISVNPEHNIFTEESDGNDHWQKVASGNRFGSFFVIYGKFRGVFNEERFMPEECDLYIQTFEGDITIGTTQLSETPVKMEFAYHPMIGDFTYVMKLKLEVLNSNNFITNCPIQVCKLDRKFPDLIDSRNNDALEFSKGLPILGNLLVDMTFTDLSEISLTNANGTGPIFSADNPNSPLINGDKYTREGSQLFERHYSVFPSFNDYTNFNFLKTDFKSTSISRIREKLLAYSMMSIKWTDEIGIDDQGIVYGLGCHPYIARIVF